MISFETFNHLSHVVIGSIGFLAGMVALSSKKGSKAHIYAGRIFSIGMLYAALTTIYFMVEEFRPLAILISVATFYCIASAILALRYQKKYSKILSGILAILPLLIFIFASLRIKSVLPEISLSLGGPILIASTFAIIFIGDMQTFRNRSLPRLHHIRRHAFRMILGFGFALMAFLRIGVKMDFLGLEMTVIVPMILSLGAGFYVVKNIEKFFPVRER